MNAKPDSPQKRVIAKLSLVKSVSALGGIFVLMLVGFLPFILGRPLEYLASRPGWSVAIVLAWVGSVFFVLVFCAIARQLVFFGRAAIWVEDGTLYYLNPRFLAVNLGEIDRVWLETYAGLGFNYVFIKIQSRSGAKRSISCAYLAEPREIVLQRISGLIKGSISAFHLR